MPDTFAQVITWAGRAFEAAGVAMLSIGSAAAIIVYLHALFRGGDRQEAYRNLREGVGRAILAGLELLVAADIIRSVAIAPTFASVGVLGLIVVVRTFLSWALEVEVTGHWPWQHGPKEEPHEREI